MYTEAEFAALFQAKVSVFMCINRTDPAALERTLEEIFARCPLAVSVKTRLGYADASEFPALLAVYRRFPLALLSVHARDRTGMYKSRPDLDAFAAALEGSPFPVEYNGDLFSPADMRAIEARFPGLDRLMLGRGAVCDPALFRRVRGGPPLEAGELREFHDALAEEYLLSGLAPAHAAARMKELWYYLRFLFPGAEREIKAIFKARSFPDYRAAVHLLLSAHKPDPGACFRQL